MLENLWFAGLDLPPKTDPFDISRSLKMPAEQIIGIRRQVEVDQAEDRFWKLIVRYKKTSFSLEIKEMGAGVAPLSSRLGS